MSSYSIRFFFLLRYVFFLYKLHKYTSAGSLQNFDTAKANIFHLLAFQILNCFCINAEKSSKKTESKITAHLKIGRSSFGLPPLLTASSRCPSLDGAEQDSHFLKHTTHSTQELTQLIPCFSTERAPVHVGYSPGVLDLAHHHCLHWCLYSLWKYMHKWALESWRSQLFCIAPSSFPCLTDMGYGDL